MQEESQIQKSETQQILVEIGKLKQEWQKFNLQHSTQELEVSQQLQQAIKNLQALITQWEQEHVLLAPIAGEISYHDFWHQDQYVKQGQILVSITPLNAQPVIARLKVPAHNFGKVSVGQKVRINLENYPYQEFGSLEGKVLSISSLPIQSYYQVIVDFPQGLLTQYGRTIPLQQNMEGEAEIVTQNRRLLERFFDRLKGSEFLI